MGATHWDVIIIGSGAGGGTLAQRLAPTGKRILVLERGDFLPREPENWSEHEVVVRGRYRSQERWRDAQGNTFEPFTHACVGGNTKLYGAALFRLREHDFRAFRHFDGVSPAWPISYDELEPYYTQAEALYSVRGEAGRDPCEPRRSAPYTERPLPHEPRIAELATKLEAVGLTPFALPLGLRLPKDERRAAPVRPGLFDGYPDPTESKADAHVVGVAGALQHANVALQTGSFAERLLTSASGREVSGVVVRTPHGSEIVRGAIYVLACGAVHSAALLLRSRNDAHPNGIANGHDLVGRHYMTHNNGALIAYGKHANESRFQKTFALTDHYRSEPDGDLPLGAVQLMGRSDRATLRGLFGDLLPSADDEQLARHTLDFWLTAEDLPRRDNRVSVDRDGQICIRYTRTNGEAYARLRRALERALRAAEPEADYLFAGYELGVAGVSHQCGTLRFGHEPEESVLDVNCRAHAVDNLYAVDGSFFCSSGALNPSLTIMANALRVGDHLAERLR